MAKRATEETGKGGRRRIVAKLGSKLLTAGGGRLDGTVLADLVRQVSALVEEGAQVAVVTSGAVAVGRDRLANPDLQRDISDRQVLAAIGQSRLVERYDTLLQEHGLMAAQALLTRADLAQRNGYLNARNTIDALLRLGVVPIINENDVVADEELRGGAFGENDSLSALVANLIDADLLVMLSDVDGLFRSDPRTDPQAELIHEVEDVDAVAGHAGPPGRGGARGDAGQGGGGAAGDGDRDHGGDRERPRAGCAAADRGRGGAGHPLPARGDAHGEPQALDAVGVERGRGALGDRRGGGAGAAPQRAQSVARGGGGGAGQL